MSGNCVVLRGDEAEGVEVGLVEWKGWPHFFWIVPGLIGLEKFMKVWNEKLGGGIKIAA